MPTDVGPMPDALRFVQFHDGRCALCGRPDELVVDHDHWSGLVRGMLCLGCNGSEGRAWTTDVLAFAGYRRRHPAAILRYHEPYRANRTCVAAVTARARLVAEWRRDIAEVDVLLRHLIEKTPVSDRGRLWDRAAKKIEIVWQRVQAEEPATAAAYWQLGVLGDLLPVLGADGAGRLRTRLAEMQRPHRRMPA